jgi:quercetin dioxygenase-like cupin family protein
MTQRYPYPHAIENGGERLVFLRRVPGATGDRIEGENRVAPGAGPPMHVHHLQAEGLAVLEGRIGYQRLGEPEHFAGPGESVVFAAGEPHRFWNAGEGDLRCSAWIEPAATSSTSSPSSSPPRGRTAGRAPTRSTRPFS